MKKNLFFGALLCMLSLSFCGHGSDSGQGVVFTPGTFREILAKAKAENKLVFIDAYTTWCGPCKRMDAQVFPKKVVGDYLNADFVNAKFDMERGEGVQIASRYNVDRYPTFLILDGDGVLQGRLIGGSPAEDFVRKIKGLVSNAK